MNVLYVSSTMMSKDFAELFSSAKKMPGQQAQKYHRLLIEGLMSNGCNVTVISGLPITHATYEGIRYPGKTISGGNITWCYLPVMNVSKIKNIDQLRGAYCKVLKNGNRNDTIVICDVLNASVAYGAALAAKRLHCPCIGIVTDLPQLMVTGVSSSHTALVNKVINLCTHYVFLTEAMNGIINLQGKPYTIIEGVCDKKMEELPQIEKKEGKKICMYAGLLDSRYGVKMMVEGFLKANLPNVELHIYGNGPYSDELKEVALKHENVRYFGSVLNEVVVKAEMQATLLINPRPTNEEFVQYSFPSKNLEYMASGTPLLTTKLPGMPRDYYEHVFFIKDESTDGVAHAISEVLLQDNTVLDGVGNRAKEFVVNRKNNVLQSEKIIKLIDFTNNATVSR